MEKASLLLSETENQQATPTGSAPKQNGGIIDSISKLVVCVCVFISIVTGSL